MLMGDQWMGSHVCEHVEQAPNLHERKLVAKISAQVKWPPPWMNNQSVLPSLNILFKYLQLKFNFKTLTNIQSHWPLEMSQHRTSWVWNGHPRVFVNPQHAGNYGTNEQPLQELMNKFVIMKPTWNINDKNRGSRDMKYCQAQLQHWKNTEDSI